MGKVAKGSRKGKKAWRTNIKTDDIDEYFEQATKDALSGASSTIASLPSESLFYVDKSTDLPVKRKIEKHRQKVLRHENLLQRNAFVQPIPSSTLKKCKQRKKIRIVKSENCDAPKIDDSAFVDIWKDKGEVNAMSKKKTTTLIPAVEVEPPGCSFNPPFEAHQDSLAEAVADEMQNIYRDELGPQPVPLIVPGEIMEEEEKLFLDADDGRESDSEEDPDNANDGLHAQRKLKTRRVTRVELNRRAKRKAVLAAEEEAKKREGLSKQIDSLSDIIKEIANEDEEKDKRHLRLVVAKHEKLMTRPPRLGRHKFEPAPKQVLLTEEISGSIRKLKGCCTLLRDRFKSIEKRGLLAPKPRRH
ncbi:hypothetical protein HPP92_001443 [Vanilla planifolia]|uniref:Ribosome biogenesis protein NOP53 n=1 Tax=Vanilla planifolia TaxID=51239 RepID=A0A835VLU6_VANPL|nr:hypothetical protein HPP92_001443 [Vanilla planifolia]